MKNFLKINFIIAMSIVSSIGTASAAKYFKVLTEKEDLLNIFDIACKPFKNRLNIPDSQEVLVSLKKYLLDSEISSIPSIEFQQKLQELSSEYQDLNQKKDLNESVEILNDEIPDAKLVERGIATIASTKDTNPIKLFFYGFINKASWASNHVYNWPKTFASLACDPTDKPTISQYEKNSKTLLLKGIDIIDFLGKAIYDIANYAIENEWDEISKSVNDFSKTISTYIYSTNRKRILEKNPQHKFDPSFFNRNIKNLSTNINSLLEKKQEYHFHKDLFELKEAFDLKKSNLNQKKDNVIGNNIINNIDAPDLDESVVLRFQTDELWQELNADKNDKLLNQKNKKNLLNQDD